MHLLLEVDTGIFTVILVLVVVAEIDIYSVVLSESSLHLIHGSKAFAEFPTILDFGYIVTKIYCNRPLLNCMRRKSRFSTVLSCGSMNHDATMMLVALSR